MYYFWNIPSVKALCDIDKDIYFDRIDQTDCRKSAAILKCKFEENGKICNFETRQFKDATYNHIGKHLNIKHECPHCGVKNFSLFGINSHWRKK